MGWTVQDIPDQRGRTAVVTGGNSGLGYQVARALALKGASVVLACRDEARGAAAAAALRAEIPGAAVQMRRLDLADLASVRQFAAGLRGGHPRLDLLVDNAGVMALPFQRTVDGFERQFGTNHLGHFALTGLLLPALLARPGARVVSVTSLMHKAGRLDLDDPNGEHGYEKWTAYAQSKLANLLFAAELHRRLQAAGSSLLAVAAHPGFAATNLQSMTSRQTRSPAARLVEVVRVAAQTSAEGALPLLYAATAPDVAGGALYGPRLLEYRGSPVRVRTNRKAADLELGRRLWNLSEQLTGVTYEFPANPAA
jgi:NAD(P)-dependent dehydrogenase (short-subunit alcohol dehydrogenase family)